MERINPKKIFTLSFSSFIIFRHQVRACVHACFIDQRKVEKKTFFPLVDTCNVIEWKCSFTWNGTIRIMCYGYAVLLSRIFHPGTPFPPPHPHSPHPGHGQSERRIACMFNVKVKLYDAIRVFIPESTDFIGGINATQLERKNERKWEEMKIKSIGRSWTLLLRMTHDNMLGYLPPHLPTLGLRYFFPSTTEKKLHSYYPFWI